MPYNLAEEGDKEGGSKRIRGLSYTQYHTTDRYDGMYEPCKPLARKAQPAQSASRPVQQIHSKGTAWCGIVILDFNQHVVVCNMKINSWSPILS